MAYADNRMDESQKYYVKFHIQKAIYSVLLCEILWEIKLKKNPKPVNICLSTGRGKDSLRRCMRQSVS